MPTLSSSTTGSVWDNFTSITATPSSENTMGKPQTLSFYYSLAPAEYILFQLHFYGEIMCTGGTELEEIGQELSMFIQQRCGGCVFPPSSITSPQLTCHRDTQQHVTYRASVSVPAVGVSREDLEAALEEWPRKHRSILLQGQRLNVEENCPVIIHALDEGECDLTIASSTPTVLVSPTMFSASPITLPVTVAVVVAVTVLGSASVVTVVIGFLFIRKKRKA